MANFQLWSRDEYGQGSILLTSTDIDEIIKRAKQEVTEINVNNALTASDKERSWEAYMVDIKTPNKKTKYVYGGSEPLINKAAYAITGEEAKSVSLQDIKKATVRIYLGNVSASRANEKDWFAKDVRGKLIDTIDHEDLQGKTSFFIKKI